VQAGNARSYTDNGDGTITDNATGLMWEKKDQAGGIHDLFNAYTWCGASCGSTDLMDGPITTTFLAGLNAGAGFAGHTDWRIPNVSELLTLVNYEIEPPSAPTVDAVFNTNCAPGCTVLTCSCTAGGLAVQPFGSHWSSTTFFETSEAWTVVFGFATVGPISSSKGLHSTVRAVRGGSLSAQTVCHHSQPLKTGQTTPFGPGSDGDVQAGNARSYTDNGDGTITDNKTGLMWEKKDQAGGIHDFNNAYTWCGASCGSTDLMDGPITTTFLAGLNAGAGFAGHTDWRIPNVNELLTVMNYGNFNPIVDTIFNTNCAPGCTVLTCSCTGPAILFTSTGYPPDPSGVWVVNFGNGQATLDVKNRSDIGARAVRGGL
jgi:hypothetical protein